MATYKLLKLKNYVYHLISGTFLVLFSLSIIQTIISEMRNEYKPSSRLAYIAGLAACLAILVFAVFTIYRSFKFEKLLLKHLAPDEIKLFFDEIQNNIQMIVKGQVIMTTHFLIVPIGHFGPYKLLRKQDIIACFKTERHQETKAIDGMLRIFTSDFKSTVVTIGGKGSSLVEQEMLNRMIKTMPWIIHENYEDFLLKSKTRGMRKILVEEVEGDRAEYIEADPAAYAPNDTLSLSGTSIPIIGQTDESEKKTEAVDPEDIIDAKAVSHKNDASISESLSKRFSSASSMINQFLPKSKKEDKDRSSAVADRFEDIEDGHEGGTTKLKNEESVPAKKALKTDVKQKRKKAAKRPVIKKESTHSIDEKYVDEKKHIKNDADIQLTEDEQTAISSFEQLIMNSSKNRSSNKYKKG